MDEGAGLESSAQGPEYGELVGLSCSSNGLACTPPEEDRQDPVDDPMLVRDSIGAHAAHEFHQKVPYPKNHPGVGAARVFWIQPPTRADDIQRA